MLSETRIKSAKPRKKEYALSDGGGLYLYVLPTGTKVWRFRYTLNGKQGRIVIGRYPTIPADEARKQATELQNKISNGINPVGISCKLPTFEELAREWLETRLAPVVTQKHSRFCLAEFQNHVFRYVGHRPIAEITAQELLTVFRRMERKGITSTVRTVRANCSRVFRYAIVTGRAERDPAAILTDALRPVPPERHYATLTNPTDIAGLLCAMRRYHGTPVVYYALWFSAYTFARPGEVRRAEWSEIEGDTWNIPAEKMKMRRPHVVPLSRQVLALLDSLHRLTGKSRYLFPNVTGRGCMSDMTVGKALRIIGYPSSVMTPHGFRGMASTILNESGLFRPDVIERQLAHVDDNAVRAAYNHAQYMDERRRMMQWYADYLTELERGR